MAVHLMFTSWQTLHHAYCTAMHLGTSCISSLLYDPYLASCLSYVFTMTCLRPIHMSLGAGHPILFPFLRTCRHACPLSPVLSPRFCLDMPVSRSPFGVCYACFTSPLYCLPYPGIELSNSQPHYNNSHYQLLYSLSYATPSV